MHRIQTVHHQHSVQIARQAQMHMDASLFKKLPSHWLCHHWTKRHFWHSNHQGEAQSWVLMDHWMVWLQLCLSIKFPHRLNAAKAPQKLNTIKLKHHECAGALRSCMETALSRLVESPLDNVTKHWNTFNEMVNNAA